MSTRIPLLEGKSFGYNRDLAPFHFVYQTLMPFRTIAVIDTGSPYTIISETTLRLISRIRYSELPSIDQLQLGRISLNIRDLGECKLLFKDENNKLLSFTHRLVAGIPINRHENEEELPNLLGRDFLNKYSFSLSYGGGKSYLEKKD